jgi:hypothetical protein
MPPRQLRHYCLCSIRGSSGGAAVAACGGAR